MKRCEAPDCVVDFEPQRSTARYCSTTCAQRARRARKAAAAQAELEAAAVEAAADTSAAGGLAEHGLVKAVRNELTEANALGTVDGQLALQMALRIAQPDTSGISTLSKELRSLLTAAKGAAPQPTGGDDPAPTPEPEDDEVAAARRAREAKLSAAAGRA